MITREPYSAGLLRYHILPANLQLPIPEVG
jgi:hypothetical protein